MLLVRKREQLSADIPRLRFYKQVAATLLDSERKTISTERNNFPPTFRGFAALHLIVYFS